CKLLPVGSPFYWQWEHPPLAMGTYTASGNSLLAVGMPCAFYSQQFVLSVTHSRVERIRENVTANRPALIGVWTPLVDPLSVWNLVGEADTSNSVPVTIMTTTGLSTTFASASFVPPITIEDYEILGTDGSEDAQGNI
nr:hypothetical protein [Tanacetum cinerariifolium]